MTDLTDFLEIAQKLADEAEQGRRIKEAAEKGVVEPAFYRYESAPGFDGRIREHARDTVFRVWELERRPAKLAEIYQGVLQRIAGDIDDGSWPRAWDATPSKRTVDRRVNELASADFSFWGAYDCPPCMMVRPGYYQPNPMLFDDSVREEIAKT